MGIWLPIITNFTIFLIILVGALIGIKQGWRLGLIKFILVVGDAVGCYFLNPFFKTLLEKISILNYLPTELVTSASFFALFLIIYALISVAILVASCVGGEVRKKGVNSAKRTKIRGLSRKETRTLKKEEKKYNKSLRTKKILRVRSKVLGCIFGVLVGIIVAGAFFLPTKYIFKAVSEKHTEIVEINKGFEYTPYGQLDKAIEYSDFVIRNK